MLTLVGDEQTQPTLRLDAADLAKKNGFTDGDAVGNFLAEHGYEEQLVKISKDPVLREDLHILEEEYPWECSVEHEATVQLVRSRLVTLAETALGRTLPTQRHTTIHNPIRLSSPVTPEVLAVLEGLHVLVTVQEAKAAVDAVYRQRLEDVRAGRVEIKEPE